jgi:putative transposase
MARLVVPGYPHHVTQRGARKQKTFFCDQDYETYIEIMAATKRKLEVAIWAYCLMPNHVHLIVVPNRRDGLAQLFGRSHRTYALEINARDGWQGHLWQERYHSFVMDEEHLLAAVRYVEMNPVRAGLCSDPVQWKWSSYQAHIAGNDDQLVVVAPMLERIVDWKKFVAIATPREELESLRKHSQSGRPIGDPAFVYFANRQADQRETRTKMVLRR